MLLLLLLLFVVRLFVSKVWLFKRVEKNSNFGGLKKKLV